MRRSRAAAPRSSSRGGNRATSVIAILVVLTALAGSARWMSGQPGGLAGAWDSSKGRQPAAVGVPPAGLEEADEPLGKPAIVARPSTSYAFASSQTALGVEPGPVTWSPCRPIHYVLNPAHAPQQFGSDLADAVAELEGATGLHFVDDGLSNEPPSDPREPYQADRYGDRWAPVLVQFADAEQVPGLAGTIAGLGGGIRLQDPKTGRATYVSGTVTIDVALLGETDLAGEPAYRAVLRHELGHVLGLQHVDDATQLMNPQNNRGISDYQDGDRTGLALLGAGACAPGL